MACGGCQKRKAAIVKGLRAVKRWMRKTPQQAKDAIMRRVKARAADGV